jgi:hypothetical protein
VLILDYAQSAQPRERKKKAASANTLSKDEETIKKLKVVHHASVVHVHVYVSLNLASRLWSTPVVSGKSGRDCSKIYRIVLLSRLPYFVKR